MTLSLPKPYCLGLRRFGLFMAVVSKARAVDQKGSNSKTTL